MSSVLPVLWSRYSVIYHHIDSCGHQLQICQLWPDPTRIVWPGSECLHAMNKTSRFAPLESAGTRLQCGSIIQDTTKTADQADS